MVHFKIGKILETNDDGLQTRSVKTDSLVYQAQAPFKSLSLKNKITVMVDNVYRVVDHAIRNSVKNVLSLMIRYA